MGAAIAVEGTPPAVYAGTWIPVYAGMTGLMARAAIAVEGTPTASYAGSWIPAYAGMTGLWTQAGIANDGAPPTARHRNREPRLVAQLPLDPGSRGVSRGAYAPCMRHSRALGPPLSSAASRWLSQS